MNGAELVISGLRIGYGDRQVLAGIDLRVEPGEALGLVGESGSGKSTLAYSIVRYLGSSARMLGGSILLNGENVLQAPPNRLRAIRSRLIAMIYQDPAAALNPAMTLGSQLLESIRQSADVRGVQMHARAHALLEQVNLANPEAILRRFPHQVSGGEKQRVMIAMALAANPRLLICDEPTTALDATTAAQVLDLLRELKTQIGASILYISHDLGTVAELTDRVAVMSDGRIVEAGAVSSILHEPQHPYTRQLLASVVSAGHCATQGKTAQREGDPPHKPRMPALLDVSRLTIWYGRDRWLDRLRKRGSRRVQTVCALDLRIGESETVGLVGESGCGKSTLAKALAGLMPFDGALALEGRAYGSVSALDRRYRSDVQIVFQHPDAALNPRKTVFQTLARAAQLREPLSGAALNRRVMELLDMVRLPGDVASRHSHELSGGEKQRVCIARALAPEPKLLICDEVTSALDVSVQATILNLLAQLQDRHKLSYLFISHDLNVVSHIAERIYVMHFGRIVDVLDAQNADAPWHPYTQALFSAMPTLQKGAQTRRVRLPGVKPDPLNPPLWSSNP